MKKIPNRLLRKISLTIFLLITGCNINNRTSVISKPSSDSLNSKILPKYSLSPSVIQTPIPNYTGLDVYAQGIYCEPVSEKDRELNSPVRIAVSKDGNYVYTINASCDKSPHYPSFGLHYYSYCNEERSKNVDPNLVKNRVINKISKDKKIEVLKINDKPVLGCNLRGEIQINNDNVMFLADIADNLYKFSDNKLTKITNVSQPSNGCGGYTLDGNCVENSFYLAKMSVDNNSIYLIFNNIDLYAGGLSGYIKKKVNINGSISDIFNGPEADYREPPIFTVYKGKEYSITDTDRLKEYVLSEKPLENISKEEINNLEQTIHNLKELDADENFNLVSEYITEIRFNSKGEIFINDLKRNLIWKVDKNKVLTKFAGDGKAGFKDGKGTDAEFNLPSAMDFDAQDNLYIADTANNAVRKITPDGTVSTFYSQNNIADKK